MIKQFKIWFNCKVLKWHDWTSNHQEGIKPTKEQLKSVNGFFDYAKMYCKHCGVESKLNIKPEEQ